MISIESKKSIIEEVSSNFINNNIEEIIQIFEQFIEVEVTSNEEDISGIATRLIKPINIIFNPDSSKNDIILSYPAYSQLE
ncbi:MAG: hypothetical protein PHZ09_13045, partial [Eubacteriales bacterium]|nr:hypothetical protein [Eubacteriales bacterium]